MTSESETEPTKAERAGEIISNLWIFGVFGAVVCVGMVAYGIAEDSEALVWLGWIAGALGTISGTVAMIASGVKLGVTASGR